jgi:hypothetical protein
MEAVPNHACSAGDGFEHRQPDALAAPPIEPVVDCGVRAILWRAITPAAAESEH